MLCAKGGYVFFALPVRTIIAAAITVINVGACVLRVPGCAAQYAPVSPLAATPHLHSKLV